MGRRKSPPPDPLRGSLEAWHAMLTVIRDESGEAGHVFLAYLVGLATEHARIMLSAKNGPGSVD
jgi:hypothetical protein